MNPKELIKDGKIDARYLQNGRGSNVITGERCDELRRKFNGRHGIKEYAKNHEIARKTISKHLRGECNCVNSEPELTHSNCFGWVSYDPLNDARNLYNEYRKHSVREIAAKYEVDPSTIRRALNKHDIR